eukprot:g15825.t1
MDTWLRLSSSIAATAETACVSLRAVVARVDRSVIFTSQSIDTTGGSAYGGHIEIFDLTLDDLYSTKWVGTVDMKYTNFHRLGKGALSAAVKVTYSSNFEPPPVLTFHGCSWTQSVEYALHLESSNVPTLITNNVMVHSLNGGIFLQEGSAVHIKDNAILGVKLADTAPRAIAEDDSQVIVMQYAGIRADTLPVRMIGNLVIADSHIGIIPYMSIGSAFRRLYIRDSTFIGTSPAGASCSSSLHCRTQTLTDPYMEGCSSMYVGSGFRRVGFVTPIQTVNKKTRDPRATRARLRLRGLDAAPMATVLPLTPRTDIVWAPFCDTELNGVAVGAQVCANTSVDLLEMVNLDRGAKDVKFGPLVMTPDVVEENGFEGGVLSSVGPFYASCPCGWDFSFYHILIKPDTTYYAEVMSLPENFRLRYWNPRAGESVLLEIFYPDSRGVNVFVGGAGEPDMALKLGRKPTLADPHGSHTVDAQALRLYITLEGSTESFNARQDLVVRRTPTVKLKMNIESLVEGVRRISIEEFNADQFQTNLAILLGIPPERIVVAAAAARRRLALVEVSEDSDAQLPLPCDDCQTPRRRLVVSSSTGLDVSIDPSTDSAAWWRVAASGTTEESALMHLQRTTVKVSSNLQALSTSDEFAAAAGGQVTVEEIQEPATVDEAANEAVPSATETATVEVIDVQAVATTSSSVEVSAEAPCVTTFGVSATVGSTTSIVYLTSELANGATTTSLCSDVDSGYSGSITLSCAAGTLKANVASCLPQSCATGDSVSVTIGSTTSSITLTADLASGIVSSQACSSVDSAYTGNFELYCNLGVLTYDVTTCSPGCGTGSSITLTVAGSTATWNPSATMASGASDTTSQALCIWFHGRCDTGWSDQHDYFGQRHQAVGVLFACPEAPELAVTPGFGECGDVNIEYSGDFGLNCVSGALQAGSSDACRRTCSTSTSATVTLDGTDYTVSPANRIAHLGTGVQACGNVRYGYGGEVSLSCDDGTLSVLSENCVPEPCPVGLLIKTTIYGITGIGPLVVNASHGAVGQVDCNSINPETRPLSPQRVALTRSVRSCTADSTVSLQLDGYSYAVAPVGMIVHGTTSLQNCSDFSSGYSGTIDLSCTDNVTAARSPAPVRGEATLHGGSVNVACNSFLGSNYDGNVIMTCSDGNYNANSSACVRACLVGETDTVVVQGTSHTDASVTARLSSGNTETLQCDTLDASYTGTFDMTCSNGLLSDTHSCHVMCLTTDSVQATIVGGAVSVSPTSDIVHGTTGTAPCGDYATGAAVTCIRGALVPDTSACLMPCEIRQAGLLTAGVDRQSYYLGLTAQIAHGTTGTESSGRPAETARDRRKQGGSKVEARRSSLCRSVEKFRVLSCDNAVLTVDSNTCVEKGCDQGLAYYLRLGSGYIEEYITSQMAHGDSFPAACSSVDASFDGNLSVICDKAEMVADYSTCLQACVNTTAGEVQLGPEVEMVYPMERTAGDGSNFTQNCSVIGEQHQGTLEATRKATKATQKNTQQTQDGRPYQMVLTCTSPTLEVFLDNRADRTFIGQWEATLLDGETITQACPSGFTGSITLTCNGGYAEQGADNCTPVPCAEGTQVFPELDGSTTVRLSQAAYAHNETYTEQCAFLNSGYTGSFQATCQYGNITADYSTCVGEPCIAGLSGTVTVGWQNSTVQSSAEVAHLTTWTVPCSDINSEFSGDVTLWCAGSQLRSDASACTQIEVGSSAVYGYAGLGRQIRIWNQKAVLLPMEAVDSGEVFGRDCSDFTNGSFVGTISATCGSLGNYLGVQVNCVPKSCSAGATVPVSKGALTGSSHSKRTMDLGHLFIETTTCESADAGLQGELRLACAYGAFVADASSCEVVCIPSRPAQVIVAGQLDVPDGKGFFANCQDFHPGFRGTVQAFCNGGALTADATDCQGLPCEVGNSTVVTLYDVSKTCADVNPDYAGTFALQCYGDVVTSDTSGCTCQAESCSTAPCGATQTFFVELSGTPPRDDVASLDHQLAFLDY